MSHLYKKFVNEKVSSLISETKNIRNCTVIAHIDHGKTTMTDSLIASSGLLSKEVAATARLLDYDLIEQERGITIKASSISLVHEFEDQEILIHLIDTPGHIDFSSHVTRGLRLTDGAIVVIDAIEGLMVQTETVTRQAMNELVRPVLFVNKVDRLIQEKRMTAQKVATEISNIVREFNAMLGKYLDDERLEEWEVSFLRGSLCIGSALDKWAIGFEDIIGSSSATPNPTRLSKDFIQLLENIIEKYKTGQEKELADQYPLANRVLNAVVRTIPNPIDAQKYRIGSIWEGNPDSELGKALVECKVEGPTLLLVGNVQPDRHAGQVAAVRVFSGTLQRGKPLRNLRTESIGKTLQIGLFMSKTRVAQDEIPAGNLAFISGIRGLAIGDTLVSPELDNPSPMKGLQYPTEPVVTYAVEPKRLADLDHVQNALQEYVSSDPQLEFEINEETGEMLLSGAGELHVEITVEKLQMAGVEVVLGEPMVVLKEEMTTSGERIHSGTSETSEFEVRALKSDEIDKSELGVVLDEIPYSECYLIDATGGISTNSEVIEWVKEAFRIVMKNGPRFNEKVRNAAIVIEQATLRYESMETSWRDITQPLVKAIRESIISGNPVLLEPWIRLDISTPDDCVGILSSILAKRKGNILEMDSERTLYRIIAEIPVRESFGLANEIRSETSGWATWGAQAGGYRALTEDGLEEEY